MAKRIYQFGFKNSKLPPKNVPVVDCRVIPNPFGLPDRERARAVQRHPMFEALVQQALELLQSHDAIAVGCEYGRHRSGTVVKEIDIRFPDKLEIEHAD